VGFLIMDFSSFRTEPLSTGEVMSDSLNRELPPADQPEIGRGLGCPGAMARWLWARAAVERPLTPGGASTEREGRPAPVTKRFSDRQKAPVHRTGADQVWSGKDGYWFAAS
jgi:hypothetical protein